MRKPHELVNLACLSVVVSLCQTFHAYAYRAPSLEDDRKFTEEALKKDPGNRVLLFRHMQIEEHMNEHKLAQEDATILVRSKATTKEEFEQNYTAYIVLGETEKALSCLNMIQKLWPNRDYYKQRGFAYQRANKWKEALQNYQAHWRQMPSDYIILVAISSMQDKLGDSAAAASSRNLYERLDKVYHDAFFKKFRELCRASGPHFDQKGESERGKMACEAGVAAVLQQISKYQKGNNYLLSR